MDSAATGANDGATPADALTSLPGVAAMVTANTVFLVRRSQNQTITVGTNATNSLYIIGMPLSTDYLYSSIPTEAKTAWDADAAQHPILTMSAGNVAIRFNGVNSGLFRVWILNPGNVAIGAVPAIHGGASGFMFRSVRYTVSGYDLTASTTRVSQRIPTVFIDGADAQVVDVYVEAPEGQITSTTTAAVDLCAIEMSANCHRAYVKNVLIWVSTSRSALSKYGFYYRGGTGGTFENIDVRLVENRTVTGVYVPCAIAIENVEVASIRNLQAKWEYFNTSAAVTPASIAVPLQVVRLILGHACLVDGVTVDLLGEPGQYNGLYVSNNSVQTAATRVRSTIKNLVVRKNLTPLLAETFGVHYAGRFDLNGKTLVDTCLLSASKTSLVQAGPASNDETCYFRALTLTGTANFNSCEYAEILSLTIPSPVANALTATNGALVYAATAIMQGTWAAEPLVSASLNARVFIDAADKPVLVSVDTSTQTQVYVNNNAGVSGYWRGRNCSFDAYTSNVFRTGGASAAIKLDMGATAPVTSDLGVWLAPPPLPAKPVAPGGTGVKTVTVFMAYKFFSSFDPSKLRIYVEVPSGAGTDRLTYDSFHDGLWTTDASTWNNDSGLTIMKCTMVVQVDRNENLGIRIQHLWYQASAYAYIDPKIQIT